MVVGAGDEEVVALVVEDWEAVELVVADPVDDKEEEDDDDEDEDEDDEVADAVLEVTDPLLEPPPFTIVKASDSGNAPTPPLRGSRTTW